MPSDRLRIVPTKCKCPLCGKTFKWLMAWTGRGMPRKYCSRCKTAKAHVLACSNDAYGGSGVRIANTSIVDDFVDM